MTDILRPLGADRIGVVVRTYPRDDDAFRQLVLARLGRFDRVRRVASIPGRLEQLLAPDAPRARSRYQDPLASEGVPVLYVFRDGTLVTPPAEALDLLPDGPGAAA
ncbi:MAG TPA: hypothetical protein VFY23_04935 [Candidatus Limnocylindrales bacterium]|nr:hypothetical protein [Candidatus Limnocylindrales bacterium]